MSGFSSKQIEAIIASAKAHGLTFVRVCKGGNEVSIAIQAGKSDTRAAIAMPMLDSGAGSAAPAESVIKSTLVGFFRPAKVAPGDKVEHGAVVAIVESLGLINEIKAESGGVLTEFLVEGGAAVEYGQPIARVVA